MKVKNKLKLGLLMILSVVASSSALADKTPHTWHTVRSLSGEWTAQLTMINEKGWFVTREGESISSFNVSPESSMDYGFGFNYEDGVDFDIAYTLTLTQKASSQMGFVSKACVYVITASAPAKPDIRASSYNDARCDWNVVHGVGEDFTVS